MGNAVPPPAPQSLPAAITAETQAIRYSFLHKRALWEAYETDGDAVVLIDEIDKAPRDFPNDLLHEFDQHSFPHPFDPTTMICPKSGRPPIVIVTSNEERRLPDAFLRRCIFHRIELTAALVEAAVESMARAAEGDGDGAGGELSLPRCGDARRSQSAFLGHPPDTGDR